MRKHLFAKTALTLLGTAAIAAPGVASAAPHTSGRALTIAATPNVITPGQGVLIYGKLTGTNVADKRILLFHRINPAARFTLVGVRHTNAEGFYEFVRADGVVNSNRNWYVMGPDRTVSRVVHEYVYSSVTLAAATSTGLTSEPIQFSGSVFPAHAGQRVLLQEQNSNSGDGWRTIATTVTNASSNFAFSKDFVVAGDYTLRALFPRDPRNLVGMSATISVAVQQRQDATFTVNPSSQIIADGQSETISGQLFAQGSTTTPEPNTQVTLYGKPVGGAFKVLATTTTDSNGDYSFTQTPLHNTVYAVRTSASPARTTANLFIGVQDVVTINASSATATVGGAVTINGTVAPDHAGHVIYLQRLNASGNWADVAVGAVNAASQYQFTYVSGQTGAVQLRVQVTGGPFNVGGVSSPVSITASGVAPANSLPPAS